MNTGLNLLQEQSEHAILQESNYQVLKNGSRASRASARTENIRCHQSLLFVPSHVEGIRERFQQLSRIVWQDGLPVCETDCLTEVSP
jgi:hypothetical protein